MILQCEMQKWQYFEFFFLIWQFFFTSEEIKKSKIKF